jgi:Antibiotic biosynthesis monooxygenase
LKSLNPNWALRKRDARVHEGRAGRRRISWVSIVKINAITVPRERFAEFEQRFATRAGRVESAAGVEGFELLRPNDDRELWSFDVLERKNG